MNDEDLPNFNSRTKKMSLVYRGMCSQTSGHLLAISGQDE
jgi:hypothetical protein